MSTDLQTTDTNAGSLFNFQSAEDAWKMAGQFSRSSLVPKQFQGKVEDCFVALVAAQHLGDNPLTVMQNMYVVHGTPAFSAKYRIARANASGVFRGRIGWDVEGSGPDLVVTARAVLARTGDEVSFSVSMAMASAEGWTKNPKYRTLPELMLRYRSATLLTRLYCEDVMLGYHTREEMEDVRTAPTQATPAAVQAKRDADAAALGLSIDAEAEEVSP
jgi:hypothetical protein